MGIRTMKMPPQRKARIRFWHAIGVLLVVPLALVAFRGQAAEGLPPVGYDKYGRIAEPQPGEAEPTRLVQQRRCFICHDMTRTDLLGPSYTAIAARYASSNKDVLTEVLAEKIITGGGLNWGTMPMVPNEHVSDKEAHAIAKWILSL